MISNSVSVALNLAQQVLYPLSLPHDTSTRAQDLEIKRLLQIAVLSADIEASRCKAEMEI